MDLATFLVQCLNSIQYGLLLFLLASGLTLIFGIMGVINLAHGSFYMIGAYVAFALSPYLGQHFITMLLVGVLITVVLGYALEWAFFSFLYERDHLQQVIEPALARGEVVLCDRFTDATFAYQGHGRGFDLATLRTLEQWVQTTPEGTLRQPDLTLWFDLDPAVAAERLAGARVPDKFEAQPVDFFRRVAAGYADRMAGDPARFARIGAQGTLEAVREAVFAACQSQPWWQGGRA